MLFSDLVTEARLQGSEDAALGLPPDLGWLACLHSVEAALPNDLPTKARKDLRAAYRDAYDSVNTLTVGDPPSRPPRDKR